MRKLLIGMVIGAMVATLALIGIAVAGGIKLAQGGLQLLDKWKDTTQSEDTNTKVYTGLKAVDLETGSADVLVKSGDVPSVQLSVHRMATGERDRDAAANLKQLQWSSVVENGTLKVRQKGDSGSNHRFYLNFNGKNAIFDARDFKFTLTVPKNSHIPIRVHTGSGDVSALDVATTLQIETGSGDVELEERIGKTSIKTGSGDVKGTACNGDSLDIDTGSGDVELDQKRGNVKATRLETGSGDVEAVLPSKADLELTLLTNSGSIENQFKTEQEGDAKEVHQVLNKGANTFKARTQSGDISVRPE